MSRSDFKAAGPERQGVASRHRGGGAVYSIIALGIILGAVALRADEAIIGGYGQIAGLVAGHESMPFSASINLVSPGWRLLAGQSDAGDTLATEWGHDESWTSRGTLSRAASLVTTPVARYEMSTTPSHALGEGAGARGVQVDVSVEALEALSMEGVYLIMRVPVKELAGGSVQVSGRQAGVVSNTLPVALPAVRHLARAQEGTNTLFQASDGSRTLGIATGRACLMAVQDDRAYGITNYTLMVRMHAGDLMRGQVSRLRLRLTPYVRPETSPARLSVDSGAPLGRFDGFGGNYCFATQTPVTDYTLSTLTQAWVRTDMTLRDWEPVNDNRSPKRTHWSRLEAGDVPGSELRHEFELARRVALPGRQWIASVWNLPGWMYLEDVGPWKPGRVVRLAHWDEMIECIVTYLQYQKRKYGIEPDLFSFNEPYAGIHVRFSADDHVRLIRELHAAFGEAGLKTRLLLGDVAKVSSLGYPQLAIEKLGPHPALGAVAFHTWNGGTEEQFGAWRALADASGLPLLITEFGLDPSAWRTHAYRSYHYGVRELDLLFQALRQARPEGVMYWQFSDDYPLARRDARGVLRPDARCADWRQLCNLTPPDRLYLSCTSSAPAVRIVAFGDPSGIDAIHIVNTGTRRQAVISGLPRGRRRWLASRPDPSRSTLRYDYPLVSSRGAAWRGELTLWLPSRGLLSLTPLHKRTHD